MGTLRVAAPSWPYQIRSVLTQKLQATHPDLPLVSITGYWERPTTFPRASSRFASRSVRPCSFRRSMKRWAQSQAMWSGCLPLRKTNQAARALAVDDACRLTLSTATFEDDGAKMLNGAVEHNRTIAGPTVNDRHSHL